MSRIYKAAPHTGSTPKAANAATMTSAAANAAAAPAPAPTAAAAAAAGAKPVSGDGYMSCTGCTKRLFGSGQRYDGKPYCTSCFKSVGGRRGDWTPAAGAPPVFGAFGGANKYGAAAAGGGGGGGAAASPKPAAAASPKPVAAAPAAASASGGSGVTECHFCDLPIAGKRAPSHDVGGEPYCDVCYREMSDSLADANEKAATVAYKLGGGNESQSQSLADKPAKPSGAAGSYPANASNFSDGDLKSMFMANYRKNKTGGAPATAPAPAPAEPTGAVCSKCGTAGDDGARFCGQCGGPMS